jgi:hypothetical protein
MLHAESVCGPAGTRAARLRPRPPSRRQGATQRLEHSGDIVPSLPLGISWRAVGSAATIRACGGCADTGAAGGGLAGAHPGVCGVGVCAAPRAAARPSPACDSRALRGMRLGAAGGGPVQRVADAEGERLAAAAMKALLTGSQAAQGGLGPQREAALQPGGGAERGSAARQVAAARRLQADGEGEAGHTAAEGGSSAPGAEGAELGIPFPSDLVKKHMVETYVR